MKKTIEQREFWKHNVNPITGFKIDSSIDKERLTFKSRERAYRVMESTMKYSSDYVDNDNFNFEEE